MRIIISGSRRKPQPPHTVRGCLCACQQLLALKINSSGWSSARPAESQATECALEFVHLLCRSGTWESSGRTWWWKMCRGAGGWQVRGMLASTCSSSLGASAMPHPGGKGSGRIDGVRPLASYKSMSSAQRWIFKNYIYGQKYALKNASTVNLMKRFKSSP